MLKIIFGAILTALAVFGWEALSWTTIGWHQNGFRAFRDESAVSEVIKANVTSGHGIYLLPSMAEAPKIATAEEKYARLDILCNNAGFGGGMAPLHEQTTEAWDRVHSVNLRGVFFGMKYGVISMMKTGGGAIVPHHALAPRVRLAVFSG